MLLSLLRDVGVILESDTENREGRTFNNFLLSNNLEELKNEPTHIRDNGSQSCIDLICTDQPYIFTETGVLPSLDPHSKHNIIHGSLNFHNPCPPPYKRKVWDYKTANTNLIRRELLNTDWKSLFVCLNTDQMTLLFTDTLLNIFSRHIYSKTITCNDKDAPWITREVKSAIRRNSRVYRKWVNRGRNPTEHNTVREIQNSTSKLIREAKKAYFEKLSDELSVQNVFGLLLKESLIIRRLQISYPSLKTILILQIFPTKLKFLMIILQINAQTMKMIVFCLIFLLKQICLYRTLM